MAVAVKAEVRAAGEETAAAAMAEVGVAQVVQVEETVVVEEGVARPVVVD